MSSNLATAAIMYGRFGCIDADGDLAGTKVCQIVDPPSKIGPVGHQAGRYIQAPTDIEYGPGVSKAFGQERFISLNADRSNLFTRCDLLDEGDIICWRQIQLCRRFLTLCNEAVGTVQIAAIGRRDDEGQNRLGDTAWKVIWNGCQMGHSYAASGFSQMEAMDLELILTYC
ncbi:MAG: hypothetical protein AAGC99_20470 [Pseudomonadota bacterium]